MTDRKTLAIALGAAVGVAAVTSAVLLYAHAHQEPVEQDINDIFEKARLTVCKLDEAVDMLRKSAA